MPSNNMNIGRDCQVVIIHPLAPGGRLDLQHVTGFDAKNAMATAVSDRLDGKVLTAYLPKNWSGTFHIDRGNAVADQFNDALEAAYFNGVNVPFGQVYQYITEVDGSVSAYQFDDCSFMLGDPGSWKNDALVKQTLTFAASRRRKV